MPFSYEMNLPTYEELTVPELEISMACLYAGAHHIGKVCEQENNEFMLCRNELKDPRKCLEEGKDVTRCAMRFFQNVKKECHQEFDDFAKCLHSNSSSWEYNRCRDSQTIFNKCVFDKLGIESPPWGWAARPHVHKAKRSMPDLEPKAYPGAADVYQEPTEAKPPKLGSRSWFR